MAHDQVTANADGTIEGDVDAIVVGAGFAGMYALHRLRRSGLSVQVFEAAGDVGGTWWWNRYPGARCDIESMDYSYSFDDDLQQDWDWTERYATQPEILRYADHVAERFDLRRHIRFDTRVTTATWDADRQRWLVATDRGDRVSARFCVMAVGCLSTTKEPEVDGIDSYEGAIHHTGRWPHEGVDFTGLRVGVIGTGSSGIQAIPHIAEQAAELFVFQRTANFSMPAHNAPLDSDFVRERKAKYADHRRLARASRSGVVIERADIAALSVGAEEREAAYRRAWESGTLYGMGACFNDLVLSEEANETAAQFVRDRIGDVVEDPEVAGLLSPRSHPFYTKRPCLDTGYYATYNRDNVTLVDIRTSPIEAITPAGIRTADGEYVLDAIVFATGFDAMTGPLLGPDIRGVDRVALRDRWTAGPRTYLGLAVSGFPNLFIVTGPGSPSVMVSMITAIEQHVDWIAACIDHLDERGVGAIEATAAAEDAWVERVNAVAAVTLFPRADSWWMGANVPGKPRVFMPFIGGFDVYTDICTDVAGKGYEGFELTSRAGER